MKNLKIVGMLSSLLGLVIQDADISGYITNHDDFKRLRRCRFEGCWGVPLDEISALINGPARDTLTNIEVEDDLSYYNESEHDMTLVPNLCRCKIKNAGD